MSIESVVIQYGSITFAFFSTGGVSLSRSTPGTGSAGQSNGEPMHATGSGSSSNSHSRKRQRTSSTQAGGNHQHFHQNAFQHHHHHQTHANNILNDPAALQTLVTMPWAHDSFAGAPSASEPSMGSGDLSPTLASAASVLGSFQNAAYSPAVQPASLPVEDPALSAPGSTALGQPAPSIEVEEDYDAFGLQHLAAMAMGQMGGDSSTSPTLENLTAAAASASASTSAAPTTGRSTTTKAPVSRPMPPQSQPIPPPGSERIPHVRQQRAHQHHGHSASVDLAAQSLLGIGQGFEFQPGDSGRAGAAASGSGAGQASKSSPTPVQYPTGQGPFAEFNGPTVNAQGLKACSSCGTANSPEWRKGPSGIKSLCNACGTSERVLLMTGADNCVRRSAVLARPSSQGQAGQSGRGQEERAAPTYEPETGQEGENRGRTQSEADTWSSSGFGVASVTSGLHGQHPGRASGHGRRRRRVPRLRRSPGRRRGGRRALGHVGRHERTRRRGRGRSWELYGRSVRSALRVVCSIRTVR